MISASGLTKQYGAVRAVDDLSFEAKPGAVTGFLGPNGAGKTTTMRMILGLDRPTAGHVTVNRGPYRRSSSPMREVGALIDPRALQTGRTARQHLRWLAEAGALSGSRVAEVLDEVELSHVADRRIAGFSLGMCQRLGLAAALLGDPDTLILDEPANGLDPAGIRWMRDLLRRMAAEGRTVFVSSHQLGEIQQTVDRVVVIDRGRLVIADDIDRLAAETQRVRVRTPRKQELLTALREHGISVGAPSPGAGDLVVTGVPAARIGDLAAERGIPLHELSRQEASLENVFLSLTTPADGEGST